MIYLLKAFIIILLKVLIKNLKKDINNGPKIQE